MKIKKCPHCENIIREVLEEEHELNDVYDKLKRGWRAGTDYTKAITDVQQALLETIDYVRKRI